MRRDYRFAKVLVLFAGLLTAGSVYAEQFAGWTHLELGAGNYGEDGHTQISQQKTVLQKFAFVSHEENFIDRLPKKDENPYDPNHQYAVLFDTLDQLVNKRGPVGVFHVNDLIADYSDYATKCLQDYAKQKKYTQVSIKSIPGDYSLISPQQTLSSYSRTVYDSVHLKNPEETFFHNGMDGDRMLTTPEYRQSARQLLQQLANLSNVGLFFFPLDVNGKFIPEEEREEFINQQRFYLPTQEWEPVAYYFPEGKIYAPTHGLVYFIKSESAES